MNERTVFSLPNKNTMITSTFGENEFFEVLYKVLLPGNHAMIIRKYNFSSTEKCNKHMTTIYILS